MIMKKIKILAAVIFSGILIYSCGGDNSKKVEDKKEDNSEYGGTFNLALSENIQGLDPITVIDGFSFQVLGQIYESLLRINEKDLSLEPMLAESWEVDGDGKVYTFSLKKGVMFHDSKCFNDGKGREMKANDVLYSLKRACSNHENNYAYTQLKGKIVGADSYHSDDAVNDIDGIKIIDDYTIQITLVKPFSNFLYSLAMVNLAIVPQEAFENEEKCYIGTGPFVFNNNIKNQTILLRNKNYHQKDKEGNQLPYIDSLVISYVNNSQDRLTMFEQGKLDVIVDLPSSSIKSVVENQISDFESKPPKYVLGRYPELVTSYLELNTTSKPLDNVKVRKAIAMAINKTKLVDVILNGEAYGPAFNGIVPPAIKGYDYESVIGLEYNVEKAKQLLSEAGFTNGENFPTLKLFNSGENQTLRVALEIQKELRSDLNINLEIVSVSFGDLLKAASEGRSDMSIGAWLADYPTPDNFLTITYGASVPKSLDENSYPNSSRYVNKEFDKLYEEAVSSVDELTKNELCLKAEQIMLNDAPIIPLWYNENYRLLQSNISGYQPSVMHIQNLVHVKKVAPVRRIEETKN